MTVFSNTPFDQLQEGMTAEITRTCQAEDLILASHVSGGPDPVRLPQGEAAPTSWAEGLISAVWGTDLPGPGSVLRAVNLRHVTAVHVGETVTAKVEVAEKLADAGVRLNAQVTKADGSTVVEGWVELTAPTTAQTADDAKQPGLVVEHHRHFDALLDMTAELDPLPTAVIAPESAHALGGAILAAERGLIAPILVGRKDRIQAAADTIGVSLDGYEIVETADEKQAARTCVQLIRDGRAASLMKGNLHTDDMLVAVIDKQAGLRTGRRLSHVFVMDVPSLPNLLLISDGAINIAPALEQKVDITQSAIDLARSLGMDKPKVGIVSAVETVTSRIPSSLDAAVLSKMADRGQITGGIVDGPFAMDNAINLDAARTKGMSSPVAGQSEVLIVPSIEAGNMLVKALSFAAQGKAAGVVLGASCPIILTSRADDDKARLASCAVAALYHARGPHKG